MSDERREDLVGGLILITIGVIFLLGNIYNISVWSLIATYWPVLFIILGGSILVKHWWS